MPVPPSPRFVAPTSAAALQDHPPIGAPTGTRDILPDEARTRTYLERRLLNTFTNAGYEHLEVPSYESFGLFGARYGDRLRERLFTFYTDREYALRPDFTGSVTRLISSGAFDGHPPPLRLCYAGQVFRYDRPQPYVGREFRQLGIELVGAPEGNADLEVIDLGLTCLKDLAPGALELRLSHAGVLRRSLEAWIPDPAARRQLEADLNHYLLYHQTSPGDRRGFDMGVDRWAAIAGADTARRLARLLDLDGTACDIEPEVRGLFPPDQELPELDSLLNRTRMLERLDYETIRVVPAGRGMLGYYSGLSYSVSLPGHHGLEVASGGRYDHLATWPGGVDMPGCGLAVNLDAVTLAFLQARGPLPRPSFGLVAWEEPVDVSSAIKLTGRIRAEGHPAVLELDSCTWGRVWTLACERGARWAVLLKAGGDLEYLSPGPDDASRLVPNRSTSLESVLRWLAGLVSALEI